MELGDLTGYVVSALNQGVSKAFPSINVILVVVGIIIVLFLLHHFLDIAMDVWKLPIAIVIDAMDVMAYNNGWLDVLAAVCAFVFFWVFFKKAHYLSKIFAVLAALEAIIGVWFFPQYAFITNLFPLCTILTLILVKRH